ncbi:Leucine-rich repeat-containing protein 71 [Branchiostoma belcheri]|nr:Leucine-rich repeat-containing protein 71 [Branchiostoma belcheri]
MEGRSGLDVFRSDQAASPEIKVATPASEDGRDSAGTMSAAGTKTPDNSTSPSPKPIDSAGTKTPDSVKEETPKSPRKPTPPTGPSKWKMRLAETEDEPESAPPSDGSGKDSPTVADGRASATKTRPRLVARPRSKLGNMILKKLFSPKGCRTIGQTSSVMSLDGFYDPNRYTMTDTCFYREAGWEVGLGRYDMTLQKCDVSSARVLVQTELVADARLLDRRPTSY